ncbi:hypothetical protein CVT17_02035 [Campylobacter concisus]|jgi:hypothetical protein|uniref:HTH cro/C1-type domain-containing protein n=1 Tax=Campylobacter concisus TaxID=199 RepID=A0AAE7P059_9BACT|nr:hypothetical protein [Campylobacter concisus]OUT14860.1 hypothetical protein B9N63_00780 [Campylobacter concisus]QPH85826.1 hypothetical protein CVT17_02035 [Campylobacter concisus]
MQIHERINSIIKSKGLKKKDFLQKFVSLEPRLKSTGEIPSIPTIYNYLNGTREIKAELIPYMAKALDVSEQELFLDNDSTEFFKEFIKKQSENESSNEKNKAILKLINLCEYASMPMLERLIEILEQNKQLTLQNMKRIGGLEFNM